jgi:hypothetical protein
VSFVSQIEIDHLAGRIERAYERLGARWNAACSTPRVWATAARILRQCRLDDPTMPVDPELYVAAQGIDPDSSDPWTDLASPRAVERYRRRIGSIIHQLRSELVREIRKAEGSIRRGRPAGEVLAERNPKLSPLGRYIVARRAMRADLAERWSFEALVQHQGCPLYREACLDLLPVDEYPRESEVVPAPRRSPMAFVGSLN